MNNNILNTIKRIRGYKLKISNKTIKTLKIFTMIFILTTGILFGHIVAKANKNNINTSNNVNVTNTNTTQQQISNKHHIEEVVTKINKCTLQPTGEYLASAIDENGEEYRFYSDNNLISTWQVLIIDTKNTNVLTDDEVIQSYNLDSYVFNND